MAGSDSKHPGGRPTKLTPDIVSKLEAAFALDASIGEACYYADISRETYYSFIKRNPEYLGKFDRLRNKPVLAAREAVITAFKGDPRLALKYLERKKKDEFSLRQELTGRDGNDLPAPIYGGLSGQPDAVKLPDEVPLQGYDSDSEDIPTQEAN